MNTITNKQMKEYNLIIRFEGWENNYKHLQRKKV
jgi:hypothetical protein